MIVAIFFALLVGAAYGASCGLEHVSMIKLVNEGKEYAYVDAGLEFEDAQNWCEGGYMNSVEFGFPFGQLLRPTTEELVFIRDNLIPDPSIEFHVGYEVYGSDYTPASFGITSGHGVDTEKHWVEGEPNDYIASIYSTNQYRVDESTGERIPLFASASLQTAHDPPRLPFICVRRLTEEFPANIGDFDKEHDCKHVSKKSYYTNKEFATVASKPGFEQARAFCETELANEGYPHGEISFERASEMVQVYGYSTYWSGYKMNRRGEYVSVYDNSRVTEFGWNMYHPDPEIGDCVITTRNYAWGFGPYETRDCASGQNLICERPLVTLDHGPSLELNGREFTLLPDKNYFDDAQSKCKARGAKLMQPTTEELNVILQKLVPGSFSLWLGYSRSKVAVAAGADPNSPEAYEIEKGYHGSESFHWKEGQPSCSGAIEATTTLGYNPSTGETFPLLTCSLIPGYTTYNYETVKNYYVCEAELNPSAGEVVPNTRINENADAMFLSGIVLIGIGSLALVGSLIHGSIKNYRVSKNKVASLTTDVTL